MKRVITVCMILLFILTLAACGSKSNNFELENGRYVSDNIENEEIDTPYLLFQENTLTIVQNIAVSYQPSGRVVIKGNQVVMETIYADEQCKFTFSLIANNKLQFLPEQSEVPETWNNWKENMVFVLEN